MTETLTHRMLADILAAGLCPFDGALAVAGAGSLPSAFPATELAAASIGAAGLAVSGLLHAADGERRSVAVDRRLASFWFASPLRPRGWAPRPPWDSLAGDYRARDGWIRLHTNAPRHREAALRALDIAADKAKVAAAVATWRAEALEAGIVEAGGCAARMRSLDEWLASAPGGSVEAEPLIHWRDGGEAPPQSLRLDPEKPLRGLRVLDLTRVLAGPVATRFLASLGADVLRIDPPDWDEPAVLPEIMPGKRSARLDLRTEADRERFTALLSTSDLLVHGYRPGALDGLGFDEAVRRGIRPGLIEVTLDAYGWTGPWQGRRGFDSLVQMSCGIAEAGMRRFGRDRPTPLPVQALDHATGYLMAFAALSAIAHRMKTGRSMVARLSLARTGLFLSRCAGQGRQDGLAPDRPADRDAGIEETGWGPANRLKPPLAIDGVSLAFDLPAMPLGSHPAAWRGT